MVSIVVTHFKNPVSRRAVGRGRFWPSCICTRVVCDSNQNKQVILAANSARLPPFGLIVVGRRRYEAMLPGPDMLDGGCFSLKTGESGLLTVRLPDRSGCECIATGGREVAYCFLSAPVHGST